MGKRAKQRRQTAHTSTGGSHTARSVSPTTPVHTASTTQRGQTTATRDRLTGEPLQAHTPKHVTHDHYPRRADPLPLKLHVLQDETVDSHAKRLGHFGGGLRWSPAFGEYIGNEASPLEASLASNYHWQEWWRSPYLVRYLAARMGIESVQALLALRLNGREYARVALAIGKSPDWLMGRERLAWRLARQMATTERTGTTGAGARN